MPVATRRNMLIARCISALTGGTANQRGRSPRSDSSIAHTPRPAATLTLTPPTPTPCTYLGYHVANVLFADSEKPKCSQKTRRAPVSCDKAFRLASIAASAKRYIRCTVSSFSSINKCFPCESKEEVVNMTVQSEQVEGPLVAG